MTDRPEAVRRAFDDHDAFEPTEEGYAVTTTVLSTTVGVEATDGSAPRYAVTVRAPTLSAAAEDEVGSALEAGWFDTFARRLADAPVATRHDVTLETCDVRIAGEAVVAELAFSHGDPDHAPEIAKTFVEYVEGTYVEGVVPGFDYRDPVATLLGQAAQDGSGERGGTPL